MQNETHQLHADGDEEEDDGVLPLVFNQQLGEDPAKWNDHPSRAWEKKRIFSAHVLCLWRM